MTAAGMGPAADRPGRDLETRLRRGDWPTDDGWQWLYRAFDSIAPIEGRLRRRVCRYFWPRRWERAGGGPYGALGVPWFGRVIPTGGIAVRRLTGLRMAAYTLRGPSIGAARDFFYRTCVFESLHLPFLMALVGLTARQLVLGRLDLALEDLLVNLLFNVYPIMHHRRTRARIVGLLEASAGRASGGATSPDARRIHS